MKTLIKKDVCTPMFIEAVFMISRYGKNLNAYYGMNG